jgi:hypothetical protein
MSQSGCLVTQGIGVTSDNDPIAHALGDVVHAGESSGCGSRWGKTQAWGRCASWTRRAARGRLWTRSPIGRGSSLGGPEVVAVLTEAGADPDAPVEGSWHAETPPHSTGLA